MAETNDMLSNEDTSTTQQPATTGEITLSIGDYPELADLQEGDTLTIVSNDGNNVIVSYSSQAPEETGTGTQEIASALQG